MPWLYRYECKGIQPWIAAGGKLRELVTGSGCLDLLRDDFEAFCAGHGLWSAMAPTAILAAGMGTVIVPDENALQLVAGNWPRRVEEVLPGIELVHGWTKCSPQPTTAEVASLVQALGAARARTYPRLPMATPLAERAGRTGEPAVRRAGNHGPDPRRLLDVAAAAKSGRERPARRRLAEILGLDAATDLPESEDDFPGGPIALVHADGNAFGSWLASAQPDHQELWAVSRAMEASVLAAVRGATAALAGHWGRADQRGRLPIRPLVVGGDDVTVLLGGGVALPWIAHFLECLAAQCPRHFAGTRKPEGITMCAGLVWLKPHWPVAHAHALAETLCKRAKDHSRTESSVLFHRIVDSTAASWRDVARAELADASPLAADPAPQLTGGPYTADGLRALVALSQSLQHKDLPSGAVRQLFDCIQDDVASGSCHPMPTASAHWQRTLQVLADAPATVQGRVLARLRGVGVPTDGLPVQAGEVPPFGPLCDAALWANMQSQAALWPTPTPNGVS